MAGDRVTPPEQPLVITAPTHGRPVEPHSMRFRAAFAAIARTRLSRAAALAIVALTIAAALAISLAATMTAATRAAFLPKAALAVVAAAR